MHPRAKDFLLLVFTFSAFPAMHGQSIEKAKERLNDIRHQDASMEKDSALAYEYNYITEAYSGQQDSLALVYIDSLESLMRTSSWKKTEGLWLRAQGKYHDRRGEFEQALEKYSQAIDAFKKVNDRSDFIAYTYILKGFVLSNNGLVEECEKTLNEIRPLTQKLENKNFLAWIIDWHGDRYFYSSFGQPDYKRALGYYLEVEKLLPQVKNIMIKADNAHCLAGCYLRLGEEEKAIEYRNRALEISKENELHSVIFAVYSDMADVYEEKGDFTKAIDYRLMSLDYARQTNWIEMETRAERNAAYTYKNAGDFQNALTHFEKLKTLEDSLSRFEVQNKYHELEVKYESGKKDLEIKQLQARNLQLLLYVSGALLVGGALFLLYYQRTNKKLLQNNAELLKKNQEIRMALTEGQNLERKRMAIELHDNINAKIAAAKWVLEAINTPEKSKEEKQVIDQLVESMSDIYEDVRFISHNLVPKDLETKTLAEIVQQLVRNLNQNQKIAFDFRLEGEDPGIQSGLKLQCYAMIMELINNTIKHSGCQHASVVIRYTTTMMSIDVEDDGRGFDPANVDSGAGLKNLSTRLNSVQGKISFTSQNGKGSAIHIAIPLTNDLALSPTR